MAYEFSLCNGINGKTEIFVRIHSAQTSVKGQVTGSSWMAVLSWVQTGSGLEWEKSDKRAHEKKKWSPLHLTEETLMFLL